MGGDGLLTGLSRPLKAELVRVLPGCDTVGSGLASLWSQVDVDFLGVDISSIDGVSEVH